MFARIRIPAASLLTIAALSGQLLAPSVSLAAGPTPAGKALAAAAAKRGSPYLYGAEGPNRFDCSGFTQYVYKRAGKKLPRTAAQQYRKVRHIRAANRRLGDLVFFHRGRTVYHVGIYAGKNRMWNAPRRGAVVRLDRIWTRTAWYGRVR